MQEREIQHAIRLSLGSEPGRVVLWRNNVGVATARDGSVVRYGLCNGSSDLIGLTAEGQFVAVEIKAARGRLSPEQEQFLALVLRMGGRAGVARTVEEARAIAGL
jgi:hypothetical protein